MISTTPQQLSAIEREDDSVRRCILSGINSNLVYRCIGFQGLHQVNAERMTILPNNQRTINGCRYVYRGKQQAAFFHPPLMLKLRREWQPFVMDQSWYGTSPTSTSLITSERSVRMTALDDVYQPVLVATWSTDVSTFRDCIRRMLSVWRYYQTPKDTINGSREWQPFVMDRSWSRDISHIHVTDHKRAVVS
ncbi:hypothetical protein ACI65C_012242 [Semiaphis heraclei]